MAALPLPRAAVVRPDGTGALPGPASLPATVRRGGAEQGGALPHCLRQCRAVPALLLLLSAPVCVRPLPESTAHAPTLLATLMPPACQCSAQHLLTAPPCLPAQCSNLLATLTGPACRCSAKHLLYRCAGRNAALPQALLLALCVGQWRRQRRRLCGGGPGVPGGRERRGHAGGDAVGGLQVGCSAVQARRQGVCCAGRAWHAPFDDRRPWALVSAPGGPRQPGLGWRNCLRWVWGRPPCLRVCGMWLLADPRSS